MPASGAGEIHQADRMEDGKPLRGSEHSKDKCLHAGSWLTQALPLAPAAVAAQLGKEVEGSWGGEDVFSPPRWSRKAERVEGE